MRKLATESSSNRKCLSLFNSPIDRKLPPSSKLAIDVQFGQHHQPKDRRNLNQAALSKMNYRHAFHAGNHTEVFKHAALVHLILALQRKITPISILDTHSGTGLYDLLSEKAGKTGEAAGGILRISGCKAPSLKPYLDIVRRYNSDGIQVYPGSPSIAASLLRPQDRLILCELHPKDSAPLKALFRGKANIHVHVRNGYEAMIALIPPPERRGLVFIDPPYEEKDELKSLTANLLAALRKWATGVFAAWYPIKQAGAARYLKDGLRAAFVSNCFCVEFMRHSVDGTRLAGSGLVIINVPWQFDQLAKQLCSDLATAFGGGDWSLEWIGEPA